MFIVGNLLGGWILSLFGFKGLLIAGMSQIFGITITNAGYYTIFALVGMLQSIAIQIRGKKVIKFTDKETFNFRDKLNKNKNK